MIEAGLRLKPGNGQPHPFLIPRNWIAVYALRSPLCGSREHRQGDSGSRRSREQNRLHSSRTSASHQAWLAAIFLVVSIILLPLGTAEGALAATISPGRTWSEGLGAGMDAVAGPNVATLSYFRVRAQPDSVFLEWQTGSEIDHSGFDLYRSQSRDSWGDPVEFFPAQGDIAGFYYSHTDTEVVPGVTYFYTLVSIGTDGSEESYRSDPESVTPGEQAPATATVTPTSPTTESSPTQPATPTATATPATVGSTVPTAPSGGTPVPSFLTPTPTVTPNVAQVADPGSGSEVATATAQPGALPSSPNTPTSIVLAAETPSLDQPPVTEEAAPIPTFTPETTQEQVDTAGPVDLANAQTGVSETQPEPVATASPVEQTPEPRATRPPRATPRPSADDEVSDRSGLLAVIAVGSLGTALVLIVLIVLVIMRGQRSG